MAPFAVQLTTPAAYEAQIASDAVGNIVDVIRTLQGFGAIYFLVPNLPELGLTPQQVALGPPAMQRKITRFARGGMCRGSTTPFAPSFAARATLAGSSSAASAREPIPRPAWARNVRRCRIRCESLRSIGGLGEGRESKAVRAA